METPIEVLRYRAMSFAGRIGWSPPYLYDRKLRGRALDDAVFEAIRRNRIFGLLSWGEEKSRWVRWAPRWPAGRLRDALRATLAADRALKGTSISDERAILTDLVLRLSAARREAA